MITHELATAFAIFLGRRCKLCGRYVADDCLCVRCRLLLPYVPHRCEPGNLIELRFAGAIPLERAYSLLRYSQTLWARELLMLIKYLQEEWTARKLGELMAADVAESGFFDTVDVLQPVPLHPLRLIRRGYNQSERIAAGISRICGCPVAQLVKRSRYTSTQTRKSASERLENVSGAFRGNSRRIRKALASANAAGREGLHIVVVDDVITMGSTIINCARAILEAVPDEAKYIRFSVMSVALAGHLRMGRITPEKLHIKDCTVSSEDFVNLQYRGLS